MVRPGKYRLLWIRSLMSLSLFMLVAVLASWLLAQYADQKEQLTKELTTTLQTAQSKITDTLLYEKFIIPAIDKNNVSVNGKKQFSIGKQANHTKAVSIMINTDENDSLKIVELKNEVSLLTKSDTLFKGRKNDTETKRTIIYRKIENDPSGKDIPPMLEMIIKNALSSGELSEAIHFKLDTNTLKTSLNEELHKKSLDFTIIWKDARKYHKSNYQQPILLKNVFFRSTYYVAVDDYFFYLFRKIAPQILFTIFLLGITAAAFIFTYKALKEQIRLGIMKNDLISNMSHELKTPISTVKVALEAISNFNPMSSDATTRDYLQMATLEMDRLEMLVNQSLNTSLLEAGKIALQQEQYDMQNLVNKTLVAMQVRLKQTSTEIKMEVVATDTCAPIDVLQMQGVLINLLDNSIKYSASSPVIRIIIGGDEKHMILSIADNGQGIPEEYLSKVFDKFFRVPTGNVHNIKGYGLGLSYVKQVVTLHNGTISVNNTGDGCMFTITLPKTTA